MDGSYGTRDGLHWGAQGLDGDPHLTYFLPGPQLSFVWNGVAEAIEVSVGGYGEPVSSYAPPPDIRGLRTAAQLLGAFRRACLDWRADHPEVSERSRPR